MDNNYKGYEPDYGMDSYDDKQSYGKDNSYYESKDSSTIVKKIKCNNINANVNGFNGIEVGTLPTTLNGLATEAQAVDEGEVGASSFGNGGGGSDGRPSSGQGSDKWCINNNNFVVIDGSGGTPVPPVPPEEACLLCFAEISAELRNAIIAALVDDGPLVIVEGQYEVPETVITIEGLCEWLGDNAPLELTEAQIDALIDGFVDANEGLERAEVEDLVDCFIDARIIAVVPPDDDPTCDECFARLSITTQNAINTILNNLGNQLIPGSTPPVTIPMAVNTIVQLCAFLDTNTINVPNQTALTALVSLFVQLTGGDAVAGQALVDCLIEAGIISVGVT